MATDSESKRNYLCDKHLQESWTASNWIYWKSLGIPVSGATLLIFAFCLPNVPKGVAQLGSEQHSTFTASKATKKHRRSSWDCWKPFGSYYQRRTWCWSNDLWNCGPWYQLNKPKWMISRNCLGPMKNWETSHNLHKEIPKYSRGRSLIPKKHQMPGSIWATYLHGKLR